MVGNTPHTSVGLPVLSISSQRFGSTFLVNALAGLAGQPASRTPREGDEPKAKLNILGGPGDRRRPQGKATHSEKVAAGVSHGGPESPNGCFGWFTVLQTPPSERRRTSRTSQTPTSRTWRTSRTTRTRARGVHKSIKGRFVVSCHSTRATRRCPGG